MELLLFGGFLSFIITGKPGERGVGKHSVNSDVGLGNRLVAYLYLLNPVRCTGTLFYLL